MNFFQKTLGGLNASYYFRHFFFGCFIAAFFFFLAIKGGGPNNHLGAYLFFIASTILYPYARFVYESIVNFIMGDNIFIANAAFLLLVKFFMMLVCWGAAIIIAPIGIIYLYFYHTWQNKKME